MIDTTTPQGRAVAAALRLAEKRDWRQITLLDIADEAGLTLAELARHVSSKSALLRNFARLVDDEVLRKTERREPEESLRERLFDVVMTRFETMASYRAGLKRIVADTAFAPELVPTLLASQGWMLTAAGIGTEGFTGAARTAGLAGVYAATFRDWLGDDDPGMARTMAALDRRLRRGEGWMRGLEQATSVGEDALRRLRAGLGRRTAYQPQAADQYPKPGVGEAAASDGPSPAPEPKDDNPGGSTSVH